jgi:hypothetical protein
VLLIGLGVCHILHEVMSEIVTLVGSELSWASVTLKVVPASVSYCVILVALGERCTSNDCSVLGAILVLFS